MLKKIFREKWFVWIVHMLIIVGIFLNGFYILENFKVNKNNQRTINQKNQLEQDKKNLTDQNSFELLDSFKTKMVKKKGFKYAGEEVFDISDIDTKKEILSTSQEIPNYQKWYNCLFTINFQEQSSNDNEQIVTNNLCR
jgi:hypothetical protein